MLSFSVMKMAREMQVEIELWQTILIFHYNNISTMIKGSSHSLTITLTSHREHQKCTSNHSKEICWIPSRVLDQD